MSTVVCYERVEARWRWLSIGGSHVKSALNPLTFLQFFVSRWSLYRAVK